MDLYKSVQILNLFTPGAVHAMDRSHAYQLSSTNTVLLLTVKDALATMETQNVFHNELNNNGAMQFK